MTNNKDLVEEAIIQMKNVEQAIAENAKGILQSTMKEEISQLVKESLQEDEDEDLENLPDEEETEFDDDYSEGDFDDSDEEYEEIDSYDIDDFDDEDLTEPVRDLTKLPNEELFKVFKNLDEKDGIIIKKDDEYIHLSDEGSDSEYLIKMSESMENRYDDNDYDDNDYDPEMDDLLDRIFNKDNDTYGDKEDDFEEVLYELEIGDIEEGDDMDLYDEGDIEEGDGMDLYDEGDLEEGDDMDLYDEGDIDEYIYEIEIEDSDMNESYNPKKSKPVGRTGKGPKFSYKEKESVKGGFNTKMKEGPKSVGTGKPKFTFDKSAENVGGKNKVVKKGETKEAARTLGNGKYFREGGLPKPRSHSKFNANIVESLNSEVQTLRGKNEEYRKALNVFREKLNEVAVFNSNLAYATRLFTEHSTTKKEKINILRRFDNVESLKESKNLYKSIKDELSKANTQSLNENVETKLNKNLTTGSSTTLIESTTYENPQFLRMKDLMSKLN